MGRNIADTKAVARITHQTVVINSSLDALMDNRSSFEHKTVRDAGLYI